jgi:hypothetical protein
MTTKSKSGRRRRSSESLQRITLNLRPSVLFGIEIVARDRRTSLSQAAEYLVAAELCNYEYAGNPVAAHLERVTAILLQKEIEATVSPDALERGTDAPETQIQQLLLASRGGKALLFPQFLRTPTENYFARALFDPPKDSESSELHMTDVVRSMLIPPLMDMLYEEASKLEAAGVSLQIAAPKLHALAATGVRREKTERSSEVEE